MSFLMAMLFVVEGNELIKNFLCLTYLYYLVFVTEEGESPLKIVKLFFYLSLYLLVSEHKLPLFLKILRLF